MKPSIWKELMRRPLGVVSFTILALLYLSAIFAGFLAVAPISDQDLERTFHPPTKIFWGEGGLRVQAYELVDPTAAEYAAVKGKSYSLKFMAPGFEYKLLGFIPMKRHLLQLDGEDGAFYPLGSDSTGRDVFSRLLYGGRISLSIGLIGISITFIMAFLIGGFSGFLGGKFDFFAMRFVEFLMAVPGLYLLLALRSALAPYFSSGQMFIAIVIILAFIGWAGTARVVRGMSLSIRKRTYVLAAESMGQKPMTILRRHILPNLISYLLVASTLSIPGYILGEAALSFLGLGIQEPASSWGLMLSQAQEVKVFFLNFWWLLTPGFMIFITVISYNVLGDVLRDIVDPKMKTQ
ncbi:ABC transporter permease [Cerasicoccus frondis]|uniref:ABC transporter permease n=1 Tax=Cerasicoccus frondis TaxID=490090 RepID=UPI00285276A2|nr:ABC transporter permease [Cerasicoccus frondis]